MGIGIFAAGGGQDVQSLLHDFALFATYVKVGCIVVSNILALLKQHSVVYDGSSGIFDIIGMRMQDIHTLSLPTTLRHVSFQKDISGCVDCLYPLDHCCITYRHAFVYSIPPSLGTVDTRRLHKFQRFLPMDRGYRSYYRLHHPRTTGTDGFETSLIPKTKTSPVIEFRSWRLVSKSCLNPDTTCFWYSVLRASLIPIKCCHNWNYTDGVRLCPWWTLQ